MNDINLFIITGRLVKAATKITDSITSFDVATNRSYKKADGEKVNEVTYISCKMFGAIAEVLTDKLIKGISVTLKGYIKQENWEDKTTGQKRSKLVMIVEQILINNKSVSSDDENNEELQNDLPF